MLIAPMARLILVAAFALHGEAAVVQEAPTDSAADPAARPPHERLGLPSSSFKTRKTDHFTISYDTSPETLGGLVNLVEQVYGSTEAFAAQRGLAAPRDGGALDILFFDRYEDYERFSVGVGEVAATTAGYYRWADRVAIFYNTLTRPDIVELTAQLSNARNELIESRKVGQRRQGAQRPPDQLQREIAIMESRRDAFVENANRVTLRHEVAHQCLFGLGVHDALRRPPTWLVEGLACQFEDVQTVSKGRLIRINDARLRDIRAALGWTANSSPPARGSRTAPPPPVRRPEEASPVVPLIEFIGHPHLITDRSRSDIVQLYAQSWALVYYLQSSDLEAFTTYLRSLNARPMGSELSPREEVAAFEACFGPLDDAFQARWLIALSKFKPAG